MELMRKFEFNSDRKRMSVVVRDNGVIKMFVKGADNIIRDRLSRKEQPFLEYNQSKLNEYSRKGLRTLMVAMKVYSE